MELSKLPKVEENELFPKLPFKLSNVMHWDTWFEALKMVCEGQSCWEKVNPDIPSSMDNDYFLSPRIITEIECYETFMREVSMIDISPKSKDSLEYYLSIRNQRTKVVQVRQSKMAAVRTWIVSSIEPSVYLMAKENITDELNAMKYPPQTPDPLMEIEADRISLRRLVTHLQRKFGTDNVNLKDQIKQEYFELLEEAKRGNINFEKWIARWSIHHHRAKRVGLIEIQGIMGVRAFIDAIGTRFDPVWARDALSRVSAYSFKVEADTLDNLCADFCRFRASLKTTNIPCDKGVNATLGTRSDQTDNKASRKSKQDHKCPCERPHHPWKPESCRILYMAVTGDKSKGKIGEAKAKRIRETYNDAKFNSLRSNIDKQGWKLKEKEQGKDIPENISAATIDPEMLKQLEVPSGVHATIDMKHPLSNCTLYDSCGALHVVNNPDLLVPGSFKPSDAEDYLESGTSSIAISGRGTRVFKKIFDGKKGPKTIDLTLNDVAVVPNFHVNIVSDSRL
ncbi:hypothetical protein E4U46_008201, partial [Claviceps purpurea]